MGQIFNRIKRIIQSQGVDGASDRNIGYEFIREEDELTRKINEAARGAGAAPENLRRDRTRNSEIDAAYAELGVPQSASVEDIKRAYKLLMKKYHPDFVQGLSEAEQKRAETRTLRVKRAYETVKKYKNF